MEKEEKTAASGEYILLNVYSDDHVRNIDRWWSWLGTRESVRNRISERIVVTGGHVPWCTMAICGLPKIRDVSRIRERILHPESLYLLCDPDHVYESFKDEFTVQVHLAEQHAMSKRKCFRTAESGAKEPLIPVL